VFVRDRDDRGAAAVEFALVVPVLILLVMGIIDYGLFFTDRLGVKQGIREGARAAVVSTGNACGGVNLDCLADEIKDKIGAAGGATYVYVDIVETAETGPADNGWQEGNELRVCAVVREDGLTGITPVPNEIRDSLRMRIETSTSRASQGETGTPPGGWGWCQSSG
jgi:hypothetical protein